MPVVRGAIPRPQEREPGERDPHRLDRADEGPLAGDGVQRGPGYGFSQESVKDGVAGDRARAALRAWFRKNRKSMPPSYASWGRDEDRRFA